jgi:glyoxylase-like metal-dependent hydrolase (beta-lactamase superfamily II)
MAPIQLLDARSSTCTYLLGDDASGEAVLIDPVEEQFDRDLAVLKSHGLKLTWVIETHVHADHITSAAHLAASTGAFISVPVACGVTGATRQVSDGEIIRFGQSQLKALHTPGHTAGSTCYLLQAEGQGHVFTGDTLLIGGCGRTDFQSGSATALYASITQVLFALPDDTIVWPGHDYAGRGHSSIGVEKASNPRLAGKSEAEFVAIMNALNLPPPARLHEALPANLRLDIPR